MKRKLTFVILLLQAFFLLSQAQTVLTRINNGLKIGEIISLKKVDTISPGAAGPKQVWDFSSAEILEDFDINLEVDGSKRASSFSTYLASKEGEDRVSYLQSTPSQRLYYGLRTDKAEIKFQQPLVELTYPFAYGDEISGQMNGTYTDDAFTTVPITGNYHIKADAWGTLVLPDGVRLVNVLRVTSIREYDHEFSGSNYHFTVKRYAFYAPNQRYAVLQIKDVIYDCINCACDGTQYSALFNSQLRSTDEPLSTATRFKYTVYPNPFERDLKIDYSVEKDTRIKINLVDMMGREVKRILNKQHDAGEYKINVDMSRFHASNFILRMQVDDILYTEKLIKKEGCQKR